jgi:hypothetical protein
MVTVINGTATIGGLGYTVGQKVFRHYHSGSWRSFIYGGSTSTPTLQEVLTEGNETETDINVKSIFFKIGDLDEDNSGTGILIDNDESSINFFRNLENFMTFNREIIAGINSLGGVWSIDFSELENNVRLKFPNKPIGNYTIATIDDVISSNTTATNGTKYLAVANLTMSDITPPSEGAFYEVTVINGTSTIGGVGYTVGQKVFRHFHSGSWRTFVYNDENRTVELLLNDVVSGSNVTGVTTETLVKTILIPANTIKSGESVMIEAISVRNATAVSTSQNRFRTSTSGTFSTSHTQIALGASGTTNFLNPLIRTLAFKNATSFSVLNASSAANTDGNIAASATNSTISFDTTVDNYIFWSITNLSASDSFYADRIRITKSKSKTSI